MSSTHVELAVDGGHASLTFATQGGVNILSSAVLRELADAVLKLKGEGGVRTVALQATGKVFVAGADIKEMAGFSREQARDYGARGQSVFNELASLPCITAAAINGPAMGGGLEIALACDFRIAVKSAKLGLPETSLGLIPGWGGISRLSKLIGPSRAKKLFLGALPVSAEDGLAFGLVDEIVNSPEDLTARMAAFCKSFRRSSPSAVALAKRVFGDGDDLSAFVDCFETQDCREGIAAFMEKRSAPWME